MEGNQGQEEAEGSNQDHREVVEDNQDHHEEEEDSQGHREAEEDSQGHHEEEGDNQGHHKVEEDNQVQEEEDTFRRELFLTKEEQSVFRSYSSMDWKMISLAVSRNTICINLRD